MLNHHAYWISYAQTCVENTVRNRQKQRIWCYPNLNTVTNAVNFLLGLPYYIGWNGWRFGGFIPLRIWWKLRVKELTK